MIVEFPTASQELADIHDIENGLSEDPTTADRAIYYIERALQYVGNDMRARIMDTMSIDQPVSHVREYVAAGFLEATKQRKERLQKECREDILAGIQYALDELDSEDELSREQLFAIAVRGFNHNLPTHVRQLLETEPPQDSIPKLKASLQRAKSFVEGKVAKTQCA